MTANTEFDQMNLPEDPLTVTPEDEIMIEQLIDDELSEDDRDFVIARLDEIQDGWRLCALAFLEDQAFRSAFRKKSELNVGVAPQETSGAGQSELARLQKKTDDRRSVWFGYAITAAALFVCVVGVFKNYPAVRLDTTTSASNDVAFAERGGEAIQKASLMPSANFTEDAEYDSIALSTFDATDQKSSRVETSAEESLLANADFARNMEIPDEANSTDDDYISPRLSRGSLANPRAKSPSVAMAPLAGNDYRGAMGGSVESPVASSIEEINDEMETASLSLAPSFSRSVKPEIRTVTLNCPQHGLNNVSASCVEGERYDPEFFRQTGAELPEELIGSINQEGARIERRHDEFRFSLGDGRVLILPIDAYNVIYDNQQIW